MCGIARIVEVSFVSAFKFVGYVGPLWICVKVKLNLAMFCKDQCGKHVILVV